MYKVTFEDGTTFDGGDPINSRWDELPNKPIQSLEYWVTPVKREGGMILAEKEIRFRFSDFEEYNHCVERVRGVNNTIDRINKVIVMGRVKKIVYQIVFDLNEGRLFQMVAPWGQEYSPQVRLLDGVFAGWENGKPLSGWKFGLLNTGYPGPKLVKL